MGRRLGYIYIFIHTSNKFPDILFFHRKEEYSSTPKFISTQRRPRHVLFIVSFCIAHLGVSNIESFELKGGSFRSSMQSCACTKLEKKIVDRCV